MALFTPDSFRDHSLQTPHIAVMDAALFELGDTPRDCHGHNVDNLQYQLPE
jgi:hypothetical protein